MLNIKIFFLKMKMTGKENCCELSLSQRKVAKIDIFWASPPGEASLLARVKKSLEPLIIAEYQLTLIDKTKNC